MPQLGGVKNVPNSLLPIVASVIAGVGLCRAEDVMPNDASPPSDAEYRLVSSEVRLALEGGSLSEGERAASSFYSRCLDTLGKGHPETREIAAWMRLFRQLRALDQRSRDAFLGVIQPIERAWAGIDACTDESLPGSESTVVLFRDFLAAKANISSSMPSARINAAHCEAGAACVLGCAREFESARPFLESALSGYRSDDGFEAHEKSVEVFLAAVLREIRAQPDKQVILLEDAISFAARYQMTGRQLWQQERAMTFLAESYYCQGNRSEADRLYAEISSRLPEKIDHETAGWCKSWCDRHEARQLMEKGDWDGAYDKILQARVGTIKYGNRNLSKGLTMERILRMSAEIQRKRGNNKEADDDLQYAQSIADHAARLRDALSAELRSLELAAGGTGQQE